MRGAIFAYFDNGGEGLGPASRQAIEQLQNRPQKSDPPANVGIRFWLSRRSTRCHV